MAGQSQFLTAMGLDITQFETAANRTDQLTKNMVHGFGLVDSALRSIPGLGRIYSATIGQLVTANAEAVESGRELARIFETDVTRSLQGAVTQIDDITTALKQLNKVSVARSISDFFVLFATRGKQDNAAIRESNRVALEQKRTALIQKSVELVAQEENSRSAIAAGSELEADQTRLRLDYENKILKATEEARKQGGPDRDKWEQAIVDRLEQQKEIYKEVYDREREAISTRFAASQEELRTAVKLAEIQFKGNERDIAAEQLKLAIRNEQLANQGGTAEDQSKTSAARKEAEYRNELAKHEYDMTVEQLGLVTKLQAERVFGQTRAAAQTQIQLQYQQRINEELRRGNTEIAKQLAAQQKLSQLQEAIRQYELGGRGRAAERQQERRSRRIARTVQSRLADREDNQAGQSGLRAGGLTSGGLTSAGLSRTKAAAKAEKVLPVTAVQKFMTDVVDALTK